jgi:hypothetical protein
MKFSENWNLINRAIVPVVYRDDGFMGQHVSGGGQSSVGTISPILRPQSETGIRGVSLGLEILPTRDFFHRQKLARSFGVLVFRLTFLLARIVLPPISGRLGLQLLYSQCQGTGFLVSSFLTSGT